MIEISVSKKRSSLPAKGVLVRRAPFATVWMQPSDSVHHETIRLVSLKLRLRKRIAAVLCTNHLFIMCNARFSTLSAASLTASLKVGWEWQVRPRFFSLPPKFITEKDLAFYFPAACVEKMWSRNASLFLFS